MIVLTITISIIYGLMILFFIRGFDKVTIFKHAENIEKTNFSIIIAFRNEVLNLPVLFKSISKLHYNNSKFEIIMINDESDDAFETLINDFKFNNPDLDLSVLNNKRLSLSPKKDAITLGINQAKYDWILSTDADCKLPMNWLKTIDAFIQKESPKMIIAPVMFEEGNTFLQNFQSLDLFSLQGSTIGGFGIDKAFLCSGANLAYYKKAFHEIEGFSGNNDIASGDDIFLLEKMLNHFPKKVKYLKSNETIVITKSEKSIRGLIEQRIRWASKTSSYNNNFGKLVGVIVFTMNLFLVILLITAILNKISWQHFGLFFLLKFNLDFVLLFKTASFFKQQNVLKNYFLSSLIYPFFIVFVALLSFNKSYQWKGRKFEE